MKILLVDDSTTITAMISDYLTIKGHYCTVSNNGRGALSLIEREKFDMVLLDLAMPEFSGFDFVRHLYENQKIKDLKIILFTGSTEDESFEDLRKMGVHTFLRKPVKLETLVSAIEEAHVNIC